MLNSLFRSDVMPNRIPERTPLSGADYFNLLVERNLQKLGYRGNVVHMAIDLEGEITLADLKSRLGDREIFAWLNAIELKRGNPLRMPSWSAGTHKMPVPVSVVDATEEVIPNELLDVDLKPSPGKLFHIGILLLKDNKTRLVFSAHHAIIDNRGVQMLVRLLDGHSGPDDIEAFFPEARVKEHFLKKLKQFNDSRHFLMDGDNKVASLLNGKAEPNLKTKYHIVDFDESETQQIDQNATASGARFGNGPFYLAAAARSVNAILIMRGTHGKTVWVPAPQDQRMRGKQGALLTNQISFMFYRIPYAELDTLKQSVKVVTDQMVNQVRTRMPESYATMMNIFRRMPLRIYNLFMKWPTKGVVTTFSFSDIGPSLKDFDSLFGHKISDVYHYPPNPVPPGFTIVFMRYNNRLRVVVGSTSQSMNPDELAKFEKLLRLDLVQGDDN